MTWYERSASVVAASGAFLVPVVAATLDHGASTVFTVGAIVGLGSLKHARRHWRDLRAHERAVLLGFLAFCLMPFISLINADDIRYFFSRYERILKFLLFIPWYFMVRSVRVDLLRALLMGCVAAGFAMAAVAYYEVEILKAAVAEGAYHKIIFGDIAMLTALLLLAALTFHGGPLILQALMLVAAGSAIYASILSATRTAWLALPVGLLIIAWVGLMNKRRHWGKIAIAVMAALAVTISLSFPVVKQQFAVSHENVSAYLDGSNPQTSIGQRLQMWGIALEVWRQHPLVGTGLGDFKHHVQEHVDAERVHLDLVFTHAHSIYMEFLATTGLLGLLVMLVCVLVLPLLLMIDRYRHAKSARSRNAALLGGVLIVSFAIFGLTEAWTARSPMMSTYVVMLAVLMACASRADEA